MKCRSCENEFIPRHKRDYFCHGCNSKRGKRNKSKGSSNERRFAKRLQGRLDANDIPVRVRRTPASGAIHSLESGDLLITEENGTIFGEIHWELKDSQNWSIEKWMEKAKEQEEDGRGRDPVIIMRKPNKREEFAVMTAEFLVDLLIERELLIEQLNANEEEKT